MDLDNENIELPVVHPWRRLFGKYIDLIFFMLFGGISLMITLELVGINVDATPDIVLTIIILLLFVPAEAAVISKTNCSLGKWMCGIKIMPKEGKGLPYKTALKRSFGSVGQGMAFGLPLINLFTMLQSYQHLKREGTSKWDENSKTEVIYSKFGVFRRLLLASILGGWFVLLYYAGKGA